MGIKINVIKLKKKKAKIIKIVIKMNCLIIVVQIFGIKKKFLLIHKKLFDINERNRNLITDYVNHIIQFDGFVFIDSL